MTNINAMHSAIGEAMVAAIELYEMPAPSQMTENRFPFTYAYDCVRAYPKLAVRLVPGTMLVEYSRSEAIPVVRAYAEAHGMTKAEAAVVFAVAYCRLENIQLDTERYSEVIRMIDEGFNDAEIVEAGNVRRLARWELQKVAAES